MSLIENASLYSNGFKESFVSMFSKDVLPDEFRRIQKLAKKAKHIPFDNKKHKVIRRRKAAEKMYVLLTPDIIGNGDFYEAINSTLHFANVQLLLSLVSFDTQQNTDGIQAQLRSQIVGYMRNMAAYQIELPEYGISHYDTRYSDKLSSCLRGYLSANGKERYIEEMIRDAGLPCRNKDLIGGM